MERLKAFRLFFLIYLLMMATLFCGPAHGAQITLTWDPSSDSTITGYRVYWGTQTNQYALLADVGNSTRSTLSDLQAGTTYYFAATAYNAKGAESPYSNEVSYTVPTGCTYSVSPTSKTFTQSGGTGTVAVTTQSGCTWTASSGASWIKITAGSAGKGSGTVSYSVSSNRASSSRTAASSIAGQIFTVTQAGTQSYTISATAGSGGSISPMGTISVNSGASQTFTITPSSGYAIGSVVVDGVSVGRISSYTFSNITANHTIAATFTAAYSLQTHTITARAGSGGKISPSGSVSVKAGASQSFAITPYYGYRISYLIVDGRYVSARSSYTFSNVTANHSISATFGK